MPESIEETLQREVVRQMLATDELATVLAKKVGGDSKDLIEDALDKADDVVKDMPTSFVRRLLTNQKIINEVTIDVNSNS